MRALAVISGTYFFVLLLPSLSPHYGFYSDELYYLACTKRLAWGYVDHPPLLVFVLRLPRELFGDSLFALRALPAAAGALAVFLTGWMARRMGGGPYAQAIAALSLAVGQSLALFTFFSVNCLAMLFWISATFAFLELCRSREPRLWVALGVLLGFGFLNKHTIAVLMGGLAAATLLSDLRRDLRTRWPWLGALAFALLASPNVLWQIAHDWPSLEFYGTKVEEAVLSPLQVLGQQIVAQNPATLPVWVSGLVFFLLSARGRRFRPLGWVLVVVLILGMVGGQPIPYRIAGIFPAAFAGGAVLLEARRRVDSGRLRRFWNTYLPLSILLFFGAIAASLILPILPPEAMQHHPLFDGNDDWRRGIGEQKLPYHLANRTHWKQLVDQVAEVYEHLDDTERANAIILADYFGHAGALEYYGRDLPPVYSPHTGYFLWGPPPGSPDPVISIGVDEAFLRRHFESVRVASVFHCAYCPGWQDDLPIHVATGTMRPAATYWPELGRIGGMDRYRRLLREQEAG